MKNKIESMAKIAFAIALIIICSWTALPSAIPITLQTFAIFAALGLLGGRNGTVAVVCYVVIGMLGLPVYSHFKGGIGIVLHDVSGGYIVGFILIALIYWLVVRFFGRSMTVEIIAMLLGLLACYVAGTAWYVWINVNDHKAVEFMEILSVCVTPFIIPDLAKLFAATALVRKLRKHMRMFR